jgi:hypothetical protein
VDATPREGPGRRGAHPSALSSPGRTRRLLRTEGRHIINVRYGPGSGSLRNAPSACGSSPRTIRTTPPRAAEEVATGARRGRRAAYVKNHGTCIADRSPDRIPQPWRPSADTLRHEHRPRRLRPLDRLATRSRRSDRRPSSRPTRRVHDDVPGTHTACRAGVALARRPRGTPIASSGSGTRSVKDAGPDLTWRSGSSFDRLRDLA